MADLKRIAAQVEREIKARYKHREGRDDRESECCRTYNIYSVGCAVPAEGDERVIAGRVKRSIDELIDAISGETRHGLLVIRKRGIEVERLSDPTMPVHRLRFSAVCHGSSLEEWDSSVRAIREQRL